jgi:hypothetical protein
VSVAAHPALLAMDYVGPAISAVLFVLIMSFVPEPTRLRFNAIFLRRLCHFEPGYQINAPDQICDCMKDSRACARGYDECDSPARKQGEHFSPSS